MLLQTYLKSAWRNIVRQPAYSFINIFGLSVGMAAAMLLFLYIKHEISYDRFHHDGDRIYRIISGFAGDQDDLLPRTLPQAADVVKEQSPLVEQSVRLKPETYNVRLDSKVFEGERVLMTDPSFADVFNFTTKAGDLKQTLGEPSSVVITAVLAEKLFGSANPINQMIEIEQNYIDTALGRVSIRYTSVKVGAVLENIPSNTHLNFSILQPYEAYGPGITETFANDVFVFFRATQNLSEEQEKSITDLVQDFARGFYPEEYKDIVYYQLQPLHDIHLGKRYGYDIGQRGNLELIYVFSAVAFFILLIAIINFINLVTARTEKRAVEAAIRKVAGAGRANITGQFLGEAMLISVFAFLLALLFAEIFIGSFSDLLNRELHIAQLVKGANFFVFLAISPLAGLLAGIYPALVFSKYHPAEILRGKARGGSRTPLLRIVLVVIQFAISIVLIVSITVFNRQIQFMKDSDLGFTAENILIFGGLSNRLVNGIEPLKAELMQHPGIRNVSTSQAYPGTSGSGMTLRRAEDPQSADISVNEFRIGADYMETFDLKLTDGRWFEFENKTDLENFVINQATVRALNLQNPVGSKVVMWRRSGEIIGVVEDFHTSSLKNKITPLVISAYAPAFYFVSVKISGSHTEEAIEHIRSTLAGFDPNYNFNEWYLESHFHSLYKQEENNNKILTYASALAIIIAMLGVLGLTSYIVTARKKEIGMRKILGATTWQIIHTLFSDITRWVILANLIAWPLAWYAMSQWLHGFPYRIDMSFWFLIFAGLVSLLIVAVSILGQTIRAARSNPVEALKAE